MPSQNLHEHLKRQIAFLKNSVSFYDSGCREEAIRMAVVMRVLFHDTGNSTSLLKLIGIKDSLQIVTTAKSVDPESLHENDFGEFMSGMTFGQELEYDAVQLDAPTITAPDWWNQLVFVRNGELMSRCQIVLATAHKDGGAHVDEPDNDLRAIKEGFWVRTKSKDNGTTVSEPMENNHFRMLRRFADELLNSKELIGLTK
jgi:hypothetical protein